MEALSSHEAKIQWWPTFYVNGPCGKKVKDGDGVEEEEVGWRRSSVGSGGGGVGGGGTEKFRSRGEGGRGPKDFASGPHVGSHADAALLMVTRLL